MKTELRLDEGTLAFLTLVKGLSDPPYNFVFSAQAKSSPEVKSGDEAVAMISALSGVKYYLVVLIRALGELGLAKPAEFTVLEQTYSQVFKTLLFFCAKDKEVEAEFDAFNKVTASGFSDGKDKWAELREEFTKLKERGWISDDFPRLYFLARGLGQFDRFEQSGLLAIVKAISELMRAAKAVGLVESFGIETRNGLWSASDFVRNSIKDRSGEFLKALYEAWQGHRKRPLSIEIEPSKDVPEGGKSSWRRTFAALTASKSLSPHPSPASGGVLFRSSFFFLFSPGGRSRGADKENEPPAITATGHSASLKL